jgi:hypothetical protein
VVGGDEGVVDDDVIACLTTDGEPFFEDVEDELISIIKIEGQIWHAVRAKRAKKLREYGGGAVNQT